MLVEINENRNQITKLNMKLNRFLVEAQVHAPANAEVCDGRVIIPNVPVAAPDPRPPRRLRRARKFRLCA